MNSFGGVFDAADYENDFYEFGEDGYRSPDGRNTQPLKIDDGAALVKAAGQLCYLSFGEKRTRNAEAQKYFDNIMSGKHGSVLQHANYSFVIWGIDRACSHELVRHAAGTAYSQMSQRYVDGKTLRFVERAEYQSDPTLHAQFEGWIDHNRAEYDFRANHLQRVMKEQLADVPPTERRKAVNSAARNCLPNETETAMVMTANVRAWRHITEMRAAKFADSPIRLLAHRLHEILNETAPYFFNDFEHKEGDGKSWLEPRYSKV